MKKLFKILKKIILYSTIIFIVGCLSIYLYIENGAKIYFPGKQRTELIKEIKSAPKLPDNFIEFYNTVYPKSLENNFWKRIYKFSTSYFSIKNDRLPSQIVANLIVSEVLNDNKGKNLNSLFLVRFIEQYTTQKECLNFEFQKIDFRHNRKGIEAVSQDLFKKPVKDLQPIEIAEILALSENPFRNDRYRNPEIAQKRTNVFLERYQDYILGHESTNSK